MNKKIVTLLAIMILLVTFSIAGAVDVVESDSHPLSTTNWSDTLTVNQFDQSQYNNCQLAYVEIDLNGTVEGTAAYENLDAAPAEITLSLKAKIEITKPDLSTLVAEPEVVEIVNAPLFDGTDDKGGTSGGTFNDLSGNVSESILVTDPAELAAYIGNGTIDFPVEASGLSVGTGSGNISTIFTTKAGASVDVTYHCENLDFGDLDDATGGAATGNPFPTLLEHNGARHIIDQTVPQSVLRLGECVDSEIDGQPVPPALGDDANAGTPAVGDCSNPDDEDGVVFIPGVAGTGWTNGTVASLNGGALQLTISGKPGIPQVFLSNGFAPLFEVTLRDNTGTPLVGPLAVGPHNVYFDIPPNFFPGFGPGNVHLRVRLSTAGMLAADGLALDGEVEDYFQAAGPTAVTLQDVQASENGSWQIPALFAALILLVSTFLILRRKNSTYNL